MATKKSRGRSNKSKQSGKERATPDYKKIFETDPPIVVGGGGSAYNFLRWGVALPFPSPDLDYSCFRVNPNIKTLYVDDGMGNTQTIRLDPKKFVVSFDD